MSFDLYLAGGKAKTPDDLIIKRSCDVLFSQINDRKDIQKFLELMNNNKLFIDSGAYSAWSKNKHIDVDDYIKFINENTDKFTLFASVDDIPGELKRKPTLWEQRESPVKSWHNYLIMREQVKEPDKLLPVFHIGEDFRHLQNILEATFNGEHIPYIGLGGTVGLGCPVKEDWYRQCFKIIQQSSNPNVKVHAFGMTNLKILENYPFQSADSTTWLRAAINGYICTKYGRICISQQLQYSPSHYNKLPQIVQEQIKKQCALYGISVEQCMENQESRQLFNINYFKDWADNYKYKGNNRYQKRLF